MARVNKSLQNDAAHWGNLLKAQFHGRFSFVKCEIFRPLHSSCDRQNTLFLLDCSQFKKAGKIFRISLKNLPVESDLYANNVHEWLLAQQIALVCGRL